MKHRVGQNEKSIFDYEGSIFNLGSKAFDLVLVSLLWLAGCLPIVTIGVSSAALYYAVDKSIIRDEMTISGAFRKSYKECLKKGIPAGVLIMAAVFIFLLNFGICRAKLDGRVKDVTCTLYMILAVIAILTACYLFPMLAHFEMPFGWYIRGALFCVFRYFPLTVLMLVLLTCGYYSVLKYPFTVLFIPGIYRLVTIQLIKTKISRFEG